MGHPDGWAAGSAIKGCRVKIQKQNSKAMEVIKQKYIELKAQLKQLEFFVRYVAPSIQKHYFDYEDSERQIIFTKNLLDFWDFMHLYLDAFDNEISSPGLDEMKMKVSTLLKGVVVKLESHKDVKDVIKDIDINRGYGDFENAYFLGTFCPDENDPPKFSAIDTIKHLYCFCSYVSKLIEESTLNNQLSPVEANLDHASNYVVLLYELGIIDFLKEKYKTMPAQRLGELCKFITSQRTDEFRLCIAAGDPTSGRAFTVKAIENVRNQLNKFGIQEKGNKNSKHN